MSSDPIASATRIRLDFTDVETDRKDVGNLSGLAYDGTRLWAASDENRAVFVLEADQLGFRATRRLSLSELFAFPRADEADLESLDFDGNRLWMCGSHTRTRDKDDDGRPGHKIRKEPSRCLLASARIEDASLTDATAFPFSGKGSVRQALKKLRLFQPFLKIPSKENGLDIEGLAVVDGTVYAGLRGPVVAGHAIVLAFPAEPMALTKPPAVHLLDLGGVGIRDITADGERLLILTGPAGKAAGPFRLHEWHPGAPREEAESPPALLSWPLNGEHPEGTCLFSRAGQTGLLVVYDGPAANRRGDGTVEADWIRLDPRDD